MRVAWMRAQAGMLSAVFVSGTAAEASGRALLTADSLGELPAVLSATRRRQPWSGTPPAIARRPVDEPRRWAGPKLDF